ncbi:MAG: hypothetical protein VR73_01350 [Gammaproteobacteria bacterium BRH_c0]|nr:MAG: hypothetical protein VR73_01350 [Gammaproteobacteria bacterium BRH_c0]
MTCSCRVLALWLLACSAAFAVIETEPLSSDELNARYRVLTDEMRCPKCQNQNLAESDSPIAADLRGEIRRLLEEGKSNADVADFMVARYGDFVLYRPALQQNTLVLWFAPAAMVLLGLLVLVLVIRYHRRRDNQASQPLNREEQQQLNALLNNDKPGES